MTMIKNKRILVVEVNWLGDVLFSTAALRQLRKMYPESYIACLVHKRCREVLEGNDYINEIIVLDEEKNHRGLFGKLGLIRQLKAKNFDTAYLFHRSFTRTLICYLSGIKNRIGYVTAKRKFLLTDAVSPPGEVIHRAAYYMYLITRKITDKKEELHCSFSFNRYNREYINNILQGEGINLGDKLVVIHTAGNWLQKRWPKEYFAKLADKLIKHYKVKLIFTGAEKEKAHISDIISLMKETAINLCARTSLKELGALFQGADLIISGDSGPLHIAVASQRPTIALFGPTDQKITGPLATKNISVLQKDVGCVIPCYDVNCPDNRCMSAISVQDVLDCIEKNKWLEIKK